MSITIILHIVIYLGRGEKGCGKTLILFGYKQLPDPPYLDFSLHKISKWVRVTAISEGRIQCANNDDLVLVRYAAAHLASNPEKCKPLQSPVTKRNLLIRLFGTPYSSSWPRDVAAIARGEYLRTHFKNMREVAAALTGVSPLFE